MRGAIERSRVVTFAGSFEIRGISCVFYTLNYRTSSSLELLLLTTFIIVVRLVVFVPVADAAVDDVSKQMRGNLLLPLQHANDFGVRNKMRRRLAFQVVILVLFKIHGSFHHGTLDGKVQQKRAVFLEQFAQGQQVVVVAHEKRGQLIDLSLLPLFGGHTFSN